MILQSEVVDIVMKYTHNDDNRTVYQSMAEYWDMIDALVDFIRNREEQEDE